MIPAIIARQVLIWLLEPKFLVSLFISFVVAVVLWRDHGSKWGVGIGVLFYAILYWLRKY